MNDFILYLFKSAVWLSGFAIVYMIFLQRERFFLLKRIFLITGVLVSFIFPLLTVYYSVEIPSPTLMPVVPAPHEQYPAGHPEIVPISQENFNYFVFLTAIYIAGIVFLIAKDLLQFRRLLKTIKKSEIIDLGAAKLIRTSEYASSFSFFNYVFVNPSVNEDEVKEIMNHELVHVMQKHWVDLVLGEFLRMLQWANPLSWVYTGFIRLNHEYLADQEALQRSSDPALYKAALLNQLFRSPVISLSNSFNYSITKTRFDMMKKIVASPYRKLRVLFILPVFAVILYSFSAPEYSYIPSEESSTPSFIIYEASPVKAMPDGKHSSNRSVTAVQQGVKGTVRDDEGKPVQGATVTTTGTSGPTVKTDKDGKFNLSSVEDNVSVFIYADGYQDLIVKPDFSRQMEIRLERKPDFKFLPARPEPLVVINGEITDKKYSEIRKELGHNFGTMAVIQGQQAIDKYGERAANGVIEILTRDKALEMGLNPPYPRTGPDDYPTFQGEQYFTFNKWVLDRVTYPEEAKAKGIEGWVTVNYAIEKGGSVKIVEAGNSGPEILTDEVSRVILSGPGFEPPKNPEADEQLVTGITMRFVLPDQILRDSPPFVVVEEMPAYPGGDAALLDFIKENVRYPDDLKQQKIGGRVIVRFIVTSDGKTEGISVLKGVHPVLDAEAVRVVQSIKGWKPGMQGGKPVNVWYMCPVNFTPPGD